jgi:hypothetical protein
MQCSLRQIKCKVHRVDLIKKELLFKIDQAVYGIPFDEITNLNSCVKEGCEEGLVGKLVEISDGILKITQD